MTRIAYRIALALLVAACFAAPRLSAATFDELLPQVATYDYDKDAAPLEEIAKIMNETQADPATLHAMAAKLAIQLPMATEAARLYICRQIYLFGDRDSVVPIGPLLLKNDSADVACYALARIPGPEATEVFLRALPDAEPGAKVAILNALGQRREPEIADIFAKAATDPDAAVARAAIDALGLMGTPVAAHALQNLWTPATAKVVEAALLNAAELIAKNEAAAPVARDLCQRLLDSSTNPAVRGAALKALALMPGATAPLDTIKKGLADESVIVQTAAAEALRQLDETVFAAAVRDLVHFAPGPQVMVINVIADRAVKGTWPPVLSLSYSPDPTISLAALEALGKVGDTACVLKLAEVAAGDDAVAAKVARKSLARLNAPLIDELMISDLQTGKDPKIQAQFLEALADRLAYDQVPGILEVAVLPDESVRQNAFKTLGKLAQGTDLPALVDLLVKEKADGPRTQAEAAIVSIAHRNVGPVSPTAAITKAWPDTAANPPARCSLAGLLGKMGDDTTLDLLRADLASTNATIQEAAVRAMAEWPTAAPLDDLQKLAESAQGNPKQLALRGFLRLVGLASSRPVEQTVALYDKGLSMATDPSEKVVALAGLADCPCEASAAIIKRYVEDAQVAAEAKLALDKIGGVKMSVTASSNEAEANNAIDGKPETRWSTSAAQAPGQWFQVDLLWPAKVEKVILDATASAGDAPKAYEVYVTDDPQNLGEPVAKGTGDNPLLEIACTPKTGRFVRIVQTGQKDLWWSIHEIKVEAQRGV